MPKLRDRAENPYRNSTHGDHHNRRLNSEEWCFPGTFKGLNRIGVGESLIVCTAYKPEVGRFLGLTVGDIRPYST